MDTDGTVKEKRKKRKNDEKKKQKLEEKKQKLEEQLIENGKKIEQMKKNK